MIRKLKLARRSSPSRREATTLRLSEGKLDDRNAESEGLDVCIDSFTDCCGENVAKVVTIEEREKTTTEYTPLTLTPVLINEGSTSRDVTCATLRPNSHSTHTAQPMKSHPSFSLAPTFPNSSQQTQQKLAAPTCNTNSPHDGAYSSFMHWVNQKLPCVGIFQEQELNDQREFTAEEKHSQNISMKEKSGANCNNLNDTLEVKQFTQMESDTAIQKKLNAAPRRESTRSLVSAGQINVDFLPHLIDSSKNQPAHENHQSSSRQTGHVGLIPAVSNVPLARSLSTPYESSLNRESEGKTKIQRTIRHALSPMKRSTSQTIASQLRRPNDSRLFSQSKALSLRQNTLPIVSKTEGDLTDQIRSGLAANHSTQHIKEFNQKSGNHDVQCSALICLGDDKDFLDSEPFPQILPVDRKPSGQLTVDSLATMDTESTLGTHNTQAAHTILTSHKSSVITDAKANNRRGDLHPTSKRIMMDDKVYESTLSDRYFGGSLRLNLHGDSSNPNSRPITPLFGCGQDQINPPSELSNTSTDACATASLSKPILGTSPSRKKIFEKMLSARIGVIVPDGSTEVTCEKVKDHAIDIATFASYHDEIITTLIAEALKDCDNVKKEENVADTAIPTNTNIGSESSKIDSLNLNDANVSSSSKSLILKKPRSPSKLQRSSSCSSPSLIWKRSRSMLWYNQDSHCKKIQLNDRRCQEKDVERAINNINAANVKETNESNRNPMDFFHPQCLLFKEKGYNNRKASSDKAPSAIGKDAILEKMNEKLSMLREIESGKFGKGGEMIRSDAVAYIVSETDDIVNEVSEKSGNSKRAGNSVILSKTELTTVRDSATDSVQASVRTSQTFKAKVETRSILTLRMGFVSISYGILLQWECDSELVKMIILRKMCREDFLERNDVSSPVGPASKHELPDVKSISPKPPPVPSVIDASTMNTGSLGSCVQKEQSYGFGFSFIPQLLSDPLPSTQSILSVSILNVKHLHAGCEKCIHYQDTSNRKHCVIRPYIRFVLGKNEHNTKPTKFNNGALYYYSRHQNSCLLPMPKEEFRWFAGQEDLVVEVRDMKSHMTSIGGRGIIGRNKRATNETLFSFDKSQSAANDPILAVVTIPLSSVKIEDEDDNTDINSEGINNAGLISWKHFKTKKDYCYGLDAKSSTYVTLPLRMTSCPTAPSGSITLQITIKVQRQVRAETPTISSTASVMNTLTQSDSSPHESIEIGPFTKIMQSWSMYNNMATDNRDSVTNTTNLENSFKSHFGSKMLRQMEWRKKWNHKTRRWSQLKHTLCLSDSTSLRNDASIVLDQKNGSLFKM